MVSDERSPIYPPILRLSKYWIEAHGRLHSGPAPAFLVCGNWSHFYMPRWTECGWMEVITLYHDSIHFGGCIRYAQINQQSGAWSLNLIASNLDTVDSFVCNADKTYSQLAYHLSEELVDGCERRCLKDELQRGRQVQERCCNFVESSVHCRFL